jgi:hypothetical protein
LYFEADLGKKFSRPHLNKWPGAVVHTCHPSPGWAGQKREIQKELEVWLKWQRSCLASKHKALSSNPEQPKKRKRENLITEHCPRQLLQVLPMKEG